MATGAAELHPLDVERPKVVVAVGHRAMRALISDLLDLDHGWTVFAVDGMTALAAAVAARPDVAVVDAADFAACCSGLLGGFEPDRIVVIGPEPDPSYRQAVLDRGAGGWLSRENIAEELCVVLGNCVASARCRAIRRKEAALPKPQIEMETPPDD